MSKFESIYNRAQTPLFDTNSPIPYDNLHLTCINSPVLQVLPYEIKTHILQLIHSPSLTHIKHIDVRHKAYYDHLKTQFKDFGINSRHSVIGPNVSTTTQGHIINSSKTVSSKTNPTTLDTSSLHYNFNVEGYAANLPSEIILETQPEIKEPETITNKLGEQVPKTSLNSFDEVSRVKGFLFEYMTLLCTALQNSDSRVYRQFAPLKRGQNETFSPGYRVDGLYENTALECKWDLIPDNFWKLGNDKRFLQNQGINLQGVSFRKIQNAPINFILFDDYIQPLLDSYVPGLSSTIQRFQKCLQIIESTFELPTNIETVSNGLYNILDQSSFVYGAERRDFILENINTIFDLRLETPALEHYLKSQSFDYKPFENECSFRYKDQTYIAHTKPIRHAADPKIAYKQLLAYRSMPIPELNFGCFLSDAKLSNKLIDFAQNKHSLFMNQGQIAPRVISDLIYKINNQQASNHDIYALLNAIQTTNNSILGLTTHIHAQF